MLDTNFLKAKMLLLNLTSASLAAKCGCSEYTIRAMCSDNYQPSTALARKIAKNLNLNREEIIKLFFSKFKELSFDEALQIEKKS